ncbi:subclass B1 metallo-beta-lactamase [Hymenobacter sp. DG25A]|uniref:subclass B1 metallo-beta-lactamase n=1 Tax=Hymenobacter sp. DG25A TaxID=1385663 RepID=UPI0006BDD648|nr:subclass B1 metallo-beta-lactamase [Hymenobacter sp. DG25A]ALD21721.1 beta-lactamase [Hymenobacter sp. DG25A]
MKFLLPVALLIAVAAKSTPSKLSAKTEKVVYQSANLMITQVAKNSFVHTSYLQTKTFGKVPCNGMVVKSGSETVVFDTPTGDQESKELIAWISKDLHCKVKAIIPTHFHEDCVGGLKEFERQKIPSFANKNTIEYAKQNKFNIPQRGFTDSLTVKVGTTKVYAIFWGEGHTKDNIVGYFPEDKVLFGGCLIKELQANKGYLGDANVQAWSATVEKIKQAYPAVQVVIPGHGKVGGPSLLDYTIQLFQQ